MKKALFLIAVIGIMLVGGMVKPAKPVTGKEQTAAIQKAVLKSHQGMIEDLEKLDIDKFFESIIDSGKGTIIQDGRVMSRKQSLISTKKGFQGIKSLRYEFSEKIVKVLSPETAVLIGKGKSSFSRHSGEEISVDFAVSSVFVLKGGKWKIIHGHHSIPNTR